MTTEQAKAPHKRKIFYKSTSSMHCNKPNANRELKRPLPLLFVAFGRLSTHDGVCVDVGVIDDKKKRKKNGPKIAFNARQRRFCVEFF